MTELLLDIIDNKNTLQEIRYQMLSPWLLLRVFLRFSENAFISVSVHEDTDEIVVDKLRPRKTFPDVSTHSPWLGAIGKPLFAAWHMTNHQGYHDALQLSFAETVMYEPKVIQMEGVASTVHVSVLVTVR